MPKRVLYLVFGCVNGSTYTLSISKPKDMLSAETIKTAMTAILATSSLGRDAVADKIIEAKYITQSSEVIDLDA